MSLTVEAVYENGCLKVSQPLPLREHERVRVTLHALAQPAAPTREEAERIVRQSYGLIGWKGDHETLERILAEADELGELP